MSGVPPPPQLWPALPAPPAPPSLGGLGPLLIVGYNPDGTPILSPGSPGRLTLARAFQGDFNFASYLYQHYADDDDLQAFVASYNALAQQYLNWYNQIGLPYYPSALVQGTLLDWVAAGLYGMVRPLLPSGSIRWVGALGTFALGVIALTVVYGLVGSAGMGVVALVGRFR